MGKHPMQPVEDVNGVHRFKKNEVVAYLLDYGGIDMNDLVAREFSAEDMAQFSQLIGYSVCGWCDLSYPSERAKTTAWKRSQRLLTT